MPNGPQTALCLTALLLVGIIALLIGLGFSKLEVNEVGLDYSANSLTVDLSKLYSNGMYFLGVGHYFIRYPKRQIEKKFEGSTRIVGRTNDGLQVDIEVSIIYRFDPTIDNLASLYLMFKEDVEEPIEHISRSVIRDVASTYTAYQFWAERDAVTRSMRERLGERMLDIFVILETVVLSDFRLPSRFQTVIDETEVQRQEKEKVQYDMSKMEQSTNATILQAQEQVKRIKLDTIASLIEINLDADAKVNEINLTVNEEIVGYKQIKQNLNFNNLEFATFIWLQEMRDSSVPKVIGVTSPANMKF